MDTDTTTADIAALSAEIQELRDSNAALRKALHCTLNDVDKLVYVNTLCEECTVKNCAANIVQCLRDAQWRNRAMYDALLITKADIYDGADVDVDAERI